MQTHYLKAALMAGWILAVAGLGYAFGTTAAGWTIVAVLSAVPAVLMARLWRAPSPSMSESIREVVTAAGVDKPRRSSSLAGMPASVAWQVAPVRKERRQR